MHPRNQSRRRDRRALRAALAGLATMALAAGAALVPSAAYAAGDRSIEGWMQPKGEIGLAEGQVTAHPGSQLSQIFPTVDPDTTGSFAASGSADSIGADFAYRIVERGVPTAYWIKGSVDWDGGPAGVCDIYRLQDGNLVEVDAANDSPYACTHETESRDNRAIVKFAVTSLVWATVRGTITPTGAISLDEAWYESLNQKAELNGTTIGDGTTDALASGQTSSWVVYRRNAEGGEGAKMDFGYRIIENGKPTPFYVVGHTTNTRDGLGYDHDAACDIYLGEPLAGGVKQHYSPYHCASNGSNVDGRADWKVDFTVSALPYTPVTEKHLAQQLITESCVNSESYCSYVPFSMVDVIKDPVVVGTPITNNGYVEQSESHEVSHTREITNIWELKWSVSYTWAKVFKASMEFGYERKEMEATEWKDSIEMNVEGRSVGWYELSPAYQHVTGDYMVRHNGVDYRILNSTFDIPKLFEQQSTIPGELEFKCKWLDEEEKRPGCAPAGSVGGGDPDTEAPGIEEPRPTTPADSGAATPTKASVASATDAAGLAHTGTDLTVPLIIGLGTLLAGLGAVLAVRLRRRATGGN
ncbi:hypothetical protein [Agromyces bauzanensis]